MKQITTSPHIVKRGFRKIFEKMHFPSHSVILKQSINGWQNGVIATKLTNILKKAKQAAKQRPTLVVLIGR